MEIADLTQAFMLLPPPWGEGWLRAVAIGIAAELRAREHRVVETAELGL